MSQALSETVSQRYGVVTLHELMRDGISVDAVRRAVTAGRMIRRHQGVYRLATAPDSFEARCAAACLADREAIVTGVAAARLWEFRHVFRATEPVVAVAHDRQPFARGVIVRRTNVLDREDWVQRPDGIRIASPSRAWFDCAQDLDDERFERLTECVVARHGKEPALWATRARLSAKGRTGLARVNRVLSQREAWQRPAGSGLELRVLKALAARGVTGLVRQHPIRLRDGIVVHPDGALPSIRWAVEVDHVTWHGGRFDAQRDKGRDRKLRLVGWQVDRVTDAEIRENLDAVVTELVALIGHRRLSHAA